MGLLLNNALLSTNWTEGRVSQNRLEEKILLSVAVIPRITPVEGVQGFRCPREGF